MNGRVVALLALSGCGRLAFEPEVLGDRQALLDALAVATDRQNSEPDVSSIAIAGQQQQHSHGLIAAQLRD